MYSVGCRRIRAQIKPKLEEKHKIRLFNYCWQRLNEIRKFVCTGKPLWDIDVYVDEKRFKKMTIGSYL